MADPFDQLAESDETNNTSASPITIGSGGGDDGGDGGGDDPDPEPDPAEVDLRARLVSIPFFERFVPDGSRTRVTTVVENAGPDAAGAFDARLTLRPLFGGPAVTLTDRMIDGLAGGERVRNRSRVRVPAGTPSGLYEVVLTVDPNDAVDEIREDNNSRGILILVF